MLEINLYKVEENRIKRVDQEYPSKDLKNKLDWIEIHSDNRTELLKNFQEWNENLEIRNCIEYPELHPFSNSIGNILIINISISNTTDIYKTDYISVILNDELIITIIPKSVVLFEKRSLSLYSTKRYSSINNFLFYLLVVKILAQSNANMGSARVRLQQLEHLLSNDPEEISSADVITCEQDINQLSDIIEDQYVGFEILLSLKSSILKVEDIQQSQNIIKGFEPLNKAMLRLEKKAESLRTLFMLIQQEKSTKKINVLTIIQAVFVPLTFIAGVYGMNFIDIPELNWPNGYLYVWLVFLGLGSGLLIYFYKKGWFD